MLPWIKSPSPKPNTRTNSERPAAKFFGADEQADPLEAVGEEGRPLLTQCKGGAAYVSVVGHVPHPLHAVVLQPERSGHGRRLLIERTLRQFAGLKLNRLPDETTILKFRHFLERHGLDKVLFQEVNNHLEKMA
ncbi:hypothetical protein [Vreelandella sp. H-I2]